MINACFHVINLAERAGPGPELGRAYANMCFVAGLIGLHPVAEMYRRLACSTAERVGDPSALAWVFLVSSMYTISVGRWAEAQDALNQVIASSDPRGARGQWGESSSVLADVAYYQGKFSDAADMRATISTTGYRNGSLAHQIWGLVGHGECALRLGKTEEAITFLEVGLALLTKKIDRTFQIRTYGLLGIAYVRQAEYLLARQAADAATSLIAQASTTPTAFYLLEGYAGVAEVHLALYEAGGERSPSELADLLEHARQACTALQHYARVSDRPAASMALGRVVPLARR